MNENDVAIIGLAGRFPGANKHQELWENLARGVVSIGEVPAERWRWQDYAGSNQVEDNRSARKWGGFLEQIDRFDRAFFGLSARETAPMDPQQRLGLELAWECFESAALRPSKFAGKPVGVFIGVANLDYKEIVEAEPGAVDAHYASGIGASVIANRLSFHFDFRGPSVSIDTACSSSLFAIHNAARALRDEECEMALAGGISLLLTHRRFTCFAKAGMLSPTGRLRSFDDAADGMVRGEGGGLILLKPLSRAIADGNRILGVVKGSAINHSGRTHSLTYPSPGAQAAVIAGAQRAAGVRPDEVSYIEAHGTGTPKGDPIEMQGLFEAFGPGEAGSDGATATCLVGSVKANIGHLESAAGIAGVIKVVLAMQHRALPPLANFETLNSRMSLEGSPFRIVDRLTPWEPRSSTDGAPLPLTAGVSSFGFAGTNAHVVLQEAPTPAARAAVADERAHILCLSARTPEALERKKQDLAAWLQGPGRRHALNAISSALIHGREHFAVRFAAIGCNREELVAALNGETAQSGGEHDDARLQALAAEYLGGAEPEGWGLGAWSSEAALDLPTYPFERVRCWVVARGAGAKSGEPTMSFPTEVKSKPQEIVLLGLESFDPPAAVVETPAAPPVPELLSSADEASIEALLEQIYSGEVDLEQAIQQVDQHSGRGRG
jgi:polyketide synthase PksN